MSFSNFAVFLNPGTTNAFTLGRLPHTGYEHQRPDPLGWGGLDAFDGGDQQYWSGPATHYFGTGANFYNGMTCVITNTSSVNYGVGTTLAGASRTPTPARFSMSESAPVFCLGFSWPSLNPTKSPTPVVCHRHPGRHRRRQLQSGVRHWRLLGVDQRREPDGLAIASGISLPSGTLTPPTTTVTGNPVGAARATVTSTSTVPNYRARDAGSYVFVITNSANGTTILSASSAVATLSFVGVAPNSFASAVISNGYGAMAYWPFNETADPSTGMAEAL